RYSDVLLDVDRSRRRHCVTIARHGHEIDFNAKFRGDCPDQVGKKNEAALQYSHYRDRARGVIRGDLPSHLRNAAPDFLLRDQNCAQRRFHRAASLWYKRERFQRGRPMLRRACFFPALFVLTSAFAFGQTPPNQQRNRVEDYAIRGKIVIANQHDFDQRIEVRLEKSALQVIQTSYTDSSGNFEFRNLAPGSYYVAVTLEGYEPVHQLVEIFNTFGNFSVTIFLNKPAVEIRERPFGIDAADPDVVDISQMKENFPKKAVQNYEKALDERQKGRLESAVKLLEDAVQIAPNFFHAHNNLGILYQWMKRYPDAEREYNRSRQLNAKSERPFVNLGSLFIEESSLQRSDREAGGKLLDQALDALEQAVKLNPRSAVGYFLLGQANYRS